MDARDSNPPTDVVPSPPSNDDRAVVTRPTEHVIAALPPSLDPEPDLHANDGLDGSALDASPDVAPHRALLTTRLGAL